MMTLKSRPFMSGNFHWRVSATAAHPSVQLERARGHLSLELILTSVHSNRGFARHERHTQRVALMCALATGRTRRVHCPPASRHAPNPRTLQP
eukprot:816230-Rhodomonas_salina.1